MKPVEVKVERLERAMVERQVLDIVSTLATELRGTGQQVTVALDDSLDRDLGISSLERVELWLRLEQAFGIRLPDSQMAEAGRPADLAAALLTAAPVAVEEPARDRVTFGTSGPAPTTASTLIDVLNWHAQAAPERIHILLREDDGQERAITYGALWERTTAVAAGLRARGLARGESVALMLRTEESFFPAFLGTLFAGGVPVPIYPPFRADRIEEYAHRQAAILRNAAARLLVTFAQAERVAGLLRGAVPTLDAVIPVDRLAIPGQHVPMPQLAAEDPALIQYTSGSTGEPRGVLLSHANILANIRSIGQALEIGPNDVGVSWLPLYHDMGLIGAWLGTLYFGVPIAILSPLAFLSRPARWLWAIHRHGGTMSPAPNFAFDLCARKIRDDELEGLDLSRWRLALNGSEVVSPETIERFTRRFAPYGFKAEAMIPVYGLAESSVGLTASPIARPPKVDRVARAPFERSRAIEGTAAQGQSSLQFVSCGHPLPGHEVRIVNEAGRKAGERVEGRIEFRGPSVTRGYFRNPEATQAVLHDGWMDSGDLGYWLDGELFITGRRKDVIVQAGRNVYPQEVEEIAGEVPGIRRGCVAAFGVFDETVGTERLVVIAESRETAADDRERLRAAVLSSVVAALGTPPDDVVIATPGSVLKTSSGKVRRAATRDAYVRAGLGLRRSVGLQWVRLILEDVRGRLGRLAHGFARCAFTAWIVVVLALTLSILWAMLLVTPAGRRADRRVKRWSRFALALAGLSPRVVGTENFDDIGPAILVANHASYIDSVVLMSVVATEVSFVAKQALTAYPLIGFVIRKAGYLTIQKADPTSKLAGADRVTEALRVGRSLLIFPEGTFVRAPGLLPFRLGAFRAAVDAGRPVVPIALRGTREVLPDGTWLFTRRPIVVTVGAPIRPEREDWQEIVRLRDLARAAIARGCGESTAG